MQLFALIVTCLTFSCHARGAQPRTSEEKNGDLVQKLATFLMAFNPGTASGRGLPTTKQTGSRSAVRSQMSTQDRKESFWTGRSTGPSIGTQRPSLRVAPEEQPRPLAPDWKESFWTGRSVGPHNSFQLPCSGVVLEEQPRPPAQDWKESFWTGRSVGPHRISVQSAGVAPEEQPRPPAQDRKDSFWTGRSVGPHRISVQSAGLALEEQHRSPAQDRKDSFWTGRSMGPHHSSKWLSSGVMPWSQPHPPAPDWKDSFWTRRPMVPHDMLEAVSGEFDDFDKLVEDLCRDDESSGCDIDMIEALKEKMIKRAGKQLKITLRDVTAEERTDEYALPV